MRSFTLTTFHSHLPIRGAIIAFALLLSSFSGCGGKSKEKEQVDFVEGTVTLNGTPLKSGDARFQITFIGAGDERQVGYVDSHGNYRIEKPPVGTVRVTVEQVAGELGPRL